MTGPHEIYSRLLFKEGQGYPLWNPSLPADCPKEYESAGIQIGDVGYLTSDGGFIFLFNISLDKDHAINTWRGVPDDFVPIDLGPNKVHHNRYPEFYPPKSLICYTEKGAKSIEGDVNATIPHSPVTIGTTGRHKSSYSEAAALILLNGGLKDDYLRDLSGWAAKNVVHFYHYVITEIGYAVPNGGLYLVTGVTNTDSWHISTFSQKSGGNHGSFEVGIKGALSGSFSMSTSSNVTGSHTPRYSPANHKGQNQSVFIRGWKMRIRSDLFRRLKGPHLTDIETATFSALRKVERPPFSSGSFHGTPISDHSISSSTTRRAEPQEAEPLETGPLETGPLETGPLETGPQETGPQETGPQETGPQETGPQETGPQETELQETEPQAGETREAPTADKEKKPQKPSKKRRGPSHGPRGPPGRRDGPGKGGGGAGPSGGRGPGGKKSGGDAQGGGRGGQEDRDGGKDNEGSFNNGGGRGRQHADKESDLEESETDDTSDSAASTVQPKLHPYHPSDVINKYLLEMCPESEVALTHDDIWSSIFRESSSVVLDDEKLIQKIKEIYKIYESENKACIFVSQNDPKIASLAGKFNMPVSQSESNVDTPSPPTSIPVTTPSQYRIGKTLGGGPYAVVKEAIHVETSKHFAFKVINKKALGGREHMVRNEIAVLKRISGGHRNIITLHDYFETANNHYLCFDLCAGGELFDRIHAKGNYYEADAASLVDTILNAVEYLHDSGIVHRNLAPENLLFRTLQEDADIMIAGFGLSRIIEEGESKILTEVCGTPGYMAPEIFKRSGYGKPVDIWAMGVITYFLLAGYAPFDRESQLQEMDAIIAGDYKFEPEEYWQNVSPMAKDFVRTCLTIDPAKRPTAATALQHKWLANERARFVPDLTRSHADLLPHMKRYFNAKQLWRTAGFSIIAINRMASLAHILHVERPFNAKQLWRKAGISVIAVNRMTSLAHIPRMKRAFNAKQLWRKAGFSIIAVNRMASLANVQQQTLFTM